METTNTNPTKHEDIKFNMDEFDIENFDFKPINKGLGFHQTINEKKINLNRRPAKVSVNIAKKENIAKTKIVTNSAVLNNRAKINDTMNSTTGLELFYQGGTLDKQDDTSPEIKDSDKIQNKEIVKVSSVVNFFIWTLDLIIVVMCSSVVFGLFAIIAGAPIEIGAVFSFAEMFYPLLGLLFCFFYLLYFSIFELGQTIFGQLFKTRVLQSNGESLTLPRAFSRSLLSLLSIPLLGLPVFLDFQGKLTDTETINA